MASFFKKNPLLNKRLKKVQKELSTINSDIRSLSKSVEKPGRKVPLVRGGESVRRRIGGAENMARTRSGKGVKGEGYGEAASKEEARVVKARDRVIHDERFADYLAGSFKGVRPLRHERRIQRNKAIVMIVFVLLALFWVLYRFFL